MEIIKIGDLEVAIKDFGQVEHCDIHSITRNWEDGWRIPNKEELDLIYEYKIKYGRFEDKYYWSSNRYIENEHFSGASVMHFGNGRKFEFGELFPAYVLAVRKKKDKNYYQNGIVTLKFCDNIEMLQYDFGLLNWDEVTKELKQLGNEWRVPTINELKKIKQYKRQVIAIINDYYWGIIIEDNLEKTTSCYFGDDFRFENDVELKNNLFVVRSSKKIDFKFTDGRYI